MYPHQYFGLFPPFPREDKVFVIMSFDERFSSRWEHVIVPGINSVEIAGRRLKAHRVDAGHISDSILTDILGRISDARLVIADLTTIGHVDGRPVRNDNVMYEVGLAHAVRLPEEVLLFRSDRDDVLFDIANVKVNWYEPDADPSGARERVSGAIVEAMRGIELTRHLAVRAAVQSLDVIGRLVLLEACAEGSIRNRPTRTLGQALGNGPANAAIRELLRIGALVAHGQQLVPEAVKDMTDVSDLVSYSPTPLGRSICEYMCAEMADGVAKSEMVDTLRTRLEGREG